MNLIEGLNKLLAYKRAERYLATVCMCTPFILIWGDSGMSDFYITLFAYASVPAIILVTLRYKNAIGQGFVFSLITGAILIFAAVFYITRGYTTRNTISNYVDMNNAQVFGLLLTMAGMLFITNGFIRSEDKIRTFKFFLWHLLSKFLFPQKWYNVVLGIALLMVVIFPCTHELKPVRFLHFFSAFVFFGGSVFCIGSYWSNANHKIISRIIASLAAGCLLAGIINLWIPVLPGYTLFWAESFTLWVIGIHYVLESFGDID